MEWTRLMNEGLDHALGGSLDSSSLDRLSSINETTRAVIIRHQKERRSKCSLRGLESFKDLVFFRYPFTHAFAAALKEKLHNENALLLDLEGDLLVRDKALSSTGSTLKKNKRAPLVLIDGTWKLAEKMMKASPFKNLQRVRLSSEWQTAYLRRQNDCADPKKGLASVEALFAAFLSRGVSSDRVEEEEFLMSLLANYYPKKEFLRKNQNLILAYENNMLT